MRARECVRGGIRNSCSAADDRAPRAVEYGPMNSSHLRTQLARLHLERIDASEIGLADNEIYMADLEEEILECHTLFVIAAVTELAVARAEQAGRLFG
jgi:hypothetical protein